MPGQSWHSCTCTHLHPSELSSCYRAARRPRPLPLWVLSPSGGRHADWRLLSPPVARLFSHLQLGLTSSIYKSVLSPETPAHSPSTFALFSSSPSQPCFSKHDLDFWILSNLALTSLSSCNCHRPAGSSAHPPTPQPSFPAARAIFSVPVAKGHLSLSTPQAPWGQQRSFLNLSIHFSSWRLMSLRRLALLCSAMHSVPRSFGTYLWTVLTSARVTCYLGSHHQCLKHQLLACLSSSQVASSAHVFHTTSRMAFSKHRHGRSPA